MRHLVLALCVALRATSPAAQPANGIPEADRVRLAEAFRLADAVGDSVWAGWGTAPFGVLLVTSEHEYLIRQADRPADFASLGYDSLLHSEVFVRARVFPASFQATFPVFSSAPTIVIGDAKSTGLGSTAWVLTVLHEHFHQLQYSRAGYQAAVSALGLAHGDSTGMWMLNFPFPYDSARVQARFAEFTQALARGMSAGAAHARNVVHAREQLRAAVTAEQYRYLAFQLWQEGVARYTEFAVARQAKAGYEPGAAFRALPDFTSYSAETARLGVQIYHGVNEAKLGEQRRVIVYATGAAYALLLDQVAPAWRAKYFDSMFTLDPLLP